MHASTVRSSYKTLRKWRVSGHANRNLISSWDASTWITPLVPLPSSHWSPYGSVSSQIGKSVVLNSIFKDYVLDWISKRGGQLGQLLVVWCLLALQTYKTLLIVFPVCQMLKSISFILFLCMLNDSIQRRLGMIKISWAFSIQMSR